MGVLQGAGMGAAIGSIIPGIGTAAGAIAGGIIGLGQTIGGWISGKDKEKKQREHEKVFGIKPEGFDASQTEGEVDAAEFESVCRQLQARFPRAKKVIITLRGSINANHNTWSGVLYDGKELFTAPTYNITHIVDRVSGGVS